MVTSLRYLPWLIGALVAITEMSTDLLVPGLPKISDHFGVSESATALTVSINLLGLALSGLVYGPMSDHFGRRSMMQIGFTLFCLASLSCSFAGSFYQLIALRFMQGLGGGVTIVVGIGAIRDRFQGPDCARRISQIEMVLTFSPAIAPIIGSIIIASTGWRAVFWLLGCLSLVGLVVVWRFFPETNIAKRRHPLSFKSILRGYLSLLNRPKYMAYGSANILCVAWLWSEYAIIPFVFVEALHVPLEYFGYYIFLNLLAYFVGTICNQLTVHRYGVSRLMLTGILIIFIDSLVLLASHFFMEPTALSITLLKLPSQFGAAMVVGNGMSKALENVGQESGTGSAMITCFQLLFGALYINQSSAHYDGTIFPLVMCMLFSSSVSLVTILFIRRVSTPPSS